MVAGGVQELEAAAAHEAELSPRQRDVLAMIARGKTNPEIAAALGVTLDGAKWNVSEILSKLGLATREDAAAYWRWRQRPAARLSRSARGFLGLGALKWGAAVAGAGAAVGVALIAWFAFTGSEPREAGPLRPFTLEAEVRVWGVNRDGPQGIPAFENEQTRSKVRWWLQDASHWRWEVVTIEPLIPARTTHAGADGSVQWSWEEGSPTYSERPHEPLPGGYVMGPSMSVMLGPVPAKDEAELIDILRQWGRDASQGAGTGTARVVAEETFLGRLTRVIEIGPTHSSATSDGVTSTGGTMRIWLDPERMVVLKSAADDPEGQSFEAAVTRLNWDQKPPDGAIRFVPPPGATKTGGDASTSSGSGSVWMSGGTGQREVTLAAGFFVPAYLPEGFSQVSESQTSSGSGAEPNGVEAVIAGPEGATPRAYIRIQEARMPRGIPNGITQGTPLQVNGKQVYLRTEGDTEILAWGEGEIAIVITARGVAREELLRVAESMRPSGGPASPPALPSPRATPVP